MPCRFVAWLTCPSADATTQCRLVTMQLALLRVHGSFTEQLVFWAAYVVTMVMGLQATGHGHAVRRGASALTTLPPRCLKEPAGQQHKPPKLLLPAPAGHWCADARLGVARGGVWCIHHLGIAVAVHVCCPPARAATRRHVLCAAYHLQAQVDAKVGHALWL